MASKADRTKAIAAISRLEAEAFDRGAESVIVRIEELLGENRRNFEKAVAERDRADDAEALLTQARAALGVPGAAADVGQLRSLLTQQAEDRGDFSRHFDRAEELIAEGKLPDDHSEEFKRHCKEVAAEAEGGDPAPGKPQYRVLADGWTPSGHMDSLDDALAYAEKARNTGCPNARIQRSFTTDWTDFDPTKEPTKGTAMPAIGTIVITQDDIKEIEGGGCVTKETSDGQKVNVVFD